MGKYDKEIPPLGKAIVGAAIVGLTGGVVACALWILGAIAIGAPVPGLINIAAGIGFVFVAVVAVVVVMFAWATQ